jgi:hypothetical protein
MAGENAKVLVIGGTGVAGSYVVEYPIRRGERWRIRCFRTHTWRWAWA